MSRNIWFTSDTHFGHRNIVSYCRPMFASLAEMEATIVANWNRAVGPSDLVYHLGDFAWTTKDAIRARPLLNGTIRLIVGNHDNIPSLVEARLFQRVQMWRLFSEIGVTVSHVPMRYDQLRHSHVNLHGHVHGMTDGLEPFHRDVSLESTDFRPVHFDEIASWAKSQEPQP